MPRRTKHQRIQAASGFAVLLALVLTSVSVAFEPVGPRLIPAQPRTVESWPRLYSPLDGTPFDAPACRLEDRLFADAADGRLDEFSPLQAALIAAGIEDAESLDDYCNKADALVEQLFEKNDLGRMPQDRARIIHQFLHQRVFWGGYDLAFTDLRAVLDHGRFNCVSATVLFNHLASRLGLEVCGLEMPGHAMSRVVADKGWIDVELTSPHWLDQPAAMAGSTEAHSSHVGSSVASVDRRQAREVSPLQLAAMVYYNRGVDLLGAKRFAEAACMNAKAVRLDPTNAVARGNLLATINNWSIELGAQGRFAEAVDLLRQGLAVAPEFEAFARNYVHIHRQWAEDLCARGQFDEAAALLERATDRLPNRVELRQLAVQSRRRAAVDSHAENR